MPDRVRELIVFPTELALRRFQQDQVLDHGWLDASGHTTFARLLSLCLPYAGLKGRRMDAATQLVMRNQVIEVARGHFAGHGTLGGLSVAALSEVLDQLLKEMAALPDDARRIVDWMLDASRSEKLRQLGTLYSVWRSVIEQEGYADALQVNRAVLKLLQGNRTAWPPLLRDAGKITFRSVRWFNPFEEACVTALNHKMKVRVETALPPGHAEASADRLDQRIRSEIMTQPWAMWAEELGDALAVNSPDLYPIDQIERIGFSRSCGAYGEIEDLARRMCWHLESTGMDPHRMALVVPDIGKVQDIIPHVFRRFNIPYYFRRGRPVLSSPGVKAFLSWLAWPLRPERDTLIDLIRNPAVRFDGREEAVGALIGKPPRIDPSSVSGLHGAGDITGKQAAYMLQERIVEPEDHFNREARQTVLAALEGFGRQVMPLTTLVDLVEELLENVTVKPRDSHEQGVWILNHHDTVGLDFDVVLMAGLNEGEFPGVPQQDALLNNDERARLRSHLEEQGRPLPALALPKTDVLYAQQSILFLNTLGTARQQIVLSYQSVDQEGNEKSESVFFRLLWNLTGWPSGDELAPGPYDRWRIDRVGDDSIFARHVENQQQTSPEDRIPMPGESFLTIVPLRLCRAKDEALQAAVAVGGTGSFPSSLDDTEVVPPLTHLTAMLKVDVERNAYLDTPIDERQPSTYCGHLSALKNQVAEWLAARREMSPTALEMLARCRYVFLLEKVFGLLPDRMVDDMPDPLDRGLLIHSILKEIYSAIANDEAGIVAERRWAVRTADGWRKSKEAARDAIPLAAFERELENHYVRFARQVAVRRMEDIELGHPGVWEADRAKVLEQILNIVRHDARTCAEDNRYPALFELSFSGDAAVDLGEVRLKGKIDRVDLVFDDADALEKVRVLDYKGSSRARPRTEEYLDEIRSNLDCQLPVYAFAAQQYFFGVVNTVHVNRMTEAGYLFYDRDYDASAKKSGKSLVAMNEPKLIDAFLDTLFRNIERLKEGDFSVDPLIASYNDYESVCRVPAVEGNELYANE